MIEPPFLQPRDKIGIVATGKKIDIADLSAAIDILTSWQLVIERGAYLISNEHNYLSASDEHRILDLQTMINDPEIKAIVFARGGYGTTRILDQVDFSPMKTSPKWLVGFSDITALHLHLYRMGIESIHGTMPVLFSSPASGPSVESLKNALFGRPDELKADANSNNRSGTATGRVVGGNLSLICDAIGTLSDPELTDAILVLEEIEEHYYKIDRMLTHLRRTGKLERLAGLVIGHFTDARDTVPAFGETVEEIVLGKVRSYGYPVAFNFPTGHENPNLSWLHGSEMTLVVTSRGSKLLPGKFTV